MLMHKAKVLTQSINTEMNHDAYIILDRACEYEVYFLMKLYPQNSFDTIIKFSYINLERK